MGKRSFLTDIYIWIMSQMPISSGQLWRNKESGAIARVIGVGKNYVSFAPWMLHSSHKYMLKTVLFRNEYFLLLRHRS